MERRLPAIPTSNGSRPCQQPRRRLVRRQCVQSPLRALLYLCETQLDTEHATLDTPCPEYAATAFMDPAGTYRYDDLASYPLGMLIEDSITASDNDSYRILRANYDAEFPAYLADQGFFRIARRRLVPHLPHAREAGLHGCTPPRTSQATRRRPPGSARCFSRPETSFIRDALAPQRVIVQDKAG